VTALAHIYEVSLDTLFPPSLQFPVAVAWSMGAGLVLFKYDRAVFYVIPNSRHTATTFALITDSRTDDPVTVGGASGGITRLPKRRACVT
jgi:hypothetical protein